MQSYEIASATIAQANAAEKSAAHFIPGKLFAFAPEGTEPLIDSDLRGF